MKNENAHMKVLHHKLDVVLVQILRYNCLQTDCSFCNDLPPAGLRPVGPTPMRVSPSDPFSLPNIFFALPPLSRPIVNVNSCVLRQSFAREAYCGGRLVTIGVYEEQNHQETGW